jgi:type IX secretion system PorP/SprF family membrane protein
MKARIIILIATLALLCLSGKAQDYHLSHYDVAGMYLNPALTGFYNPSKNDYRVYFDQRAQWRALGVKPFSTSYLGFDRPLEVKSRNFGVGGYIINNSAGIGNFNTLSFMASGAYDIINSRTKSVSVIREVRHLLTVGLQIGLFYRSTNPERLSYDVQYTPGSGGFDQSLPNNEAYNRYSMAKFDASYGIYYKYVDRKAKVRPYAGFSMAHLTRPMESLTGATSRLPIKFTGHAGVETIVNEKVTLVPRVLYMSQAKSTELTAGMQLYYTLNENESKLLAGFDWRQRDACIASLGILTQGYAVRFSYDINTSYLGSYLRNRGAFEISLVYFGEKGKPFFSTVSQF